MTAKPKAIVLLSGGLDSATCLAIARQEGFEPIALSFDYGQRHNAELAAAQRIAQAFAIGDHRVIRLELGSIVWFNYSDRSLSLSDRTQNSNSTGIISNRKARR